MDAMREAIRRWPLLVGYGVIVVAMVAGFLQVRSLQRDLERQSLERAYALCETNNDTLTVLGLVLDALAEPREDDQPGEFEERQQLREQLDPLLHHQECVPPPRTAPPTPSPRPDPSG